MSERTGIESITIVKSDDWHGLFVNGDLVEEGHRIDQRNLQKLIATSGLVPQERWVTDEYYNDTLGQVGSYPQRLDDVECE